MFQAENLASKRALESKRQELCIEDLEEELAGLIKQRDEEVSIQREL